MIKYRKGSLYFLGILLIVALVLSATFVLALSRSERQAIASCNKECSSIKSDEKKLCTLNYKTCQNNCRFDYKECIYEKRTEKDACRDTCITSIDDRRDRSSCLRGCSRVYSEARKSQCDYRSCREVCREERIDCKAIVSDNHGQCREQCSLTQTVSEDRLEIIPVNQYDYFVASEEECESTGGYYQKLCKGPYFRITCTRDKYCQCGGDRDYSCPADLECIKNHGIEVGGRGNTYQDGWRDIQGRHLGDSGICGVELEEFQ